MVRSFLVVVNVFNSPLFFLPCFVVHGGVSFSALMCIIKVGIEVDGSFSIKLWMLLLMSKYDSFP